MKTPKQQLFNAKKQKLKRQKLRNNATPAEKKMWSYLQNSQLFDRKFRRQQGIGPYIVDFYCPKEKLAVELDGEIHLTNEAREYDRKRGEYLLDHGITTVRFRNEEVFNDGKSVLQAIAKFFSGIFFRLIFFFHHPCIPSSLRRGYRGGKKEEKKL